MRTHWPFAPHNDQEFPAPPKEQTSRMKAEMLAADIRKDPGGTAHVVGSGVFGSVIITPVTPRVMAMYRELRKNDQVRMPRDSIYKHKSVAIKVITPHIDHIVNGRVMRSFVRSAVWEMQIQARLSRAPCKFVGGQKFCAEAFVPKVIAGAYSPKHRAVFIIMEVVAGQPVTNRKRTVTKAEFTEIERAVLTLWLNGIMHNDLSTDNVFIGRTAKGDPKVTLIDYGLAVPVRDIIVNATGASNARRLGAFHAGVRDLIRRTQWPRIPFTLARFEMRTSPQGRRYGRVVNHTRRNGTLSAFNALVGQAGLDRLEEKIGIGTQNDMQLANNLRAELHENNIKHFTT
jgi:serine/threonine protein kinase